MTYGELNLIFLVIAGLATWVIKSRHRCFTTPVVALPMLVLTAVFDNLIIAAGIVDYDDSKLIGLDIGLVPIEDFAYTVVAILLVPAIWKAVNKE
jgi:lycopene cyclase domain-containing protein